jgi:hypothetical protein
MKRECKKCEFFKSINISNDVGKCRFNPPVMNGERCEFPVVFGDLWCGQFKSREKLSGLSEKDVHTEHCCAHCGCKYGEDDVCPVVQGYKKQSFPCGKAYTCGWTDEFNY